MRKRHSSKMRFFSALTLFLFCLLCFVPGRAAEDFGAKEPSDFLRELIQTAQKGEVILQDMVAQKFRSLGCAVEVLAISPSELKLKNEFSTSESSGSEKRTSVVGVWKGTGGGKSLLLFAHPDGEPLPKTAFKYPVHGGMTEDGKIFGWGVSDDLAGVAIMAAAVEKLQATGFKPQGDVILCSTPAKRGAQGVIALLEKGYLADGALYLHPAESGAGLREVKAIASGMLTFRVSVSGKQPETSEPGKTAFAHLGVSALDRALIIVRALKELDEERGRRVNHQALDKAVGRSTNLLIAYLQAGSQGQLTRFPVECVLEASLTFPPNEYLPDVQKEVQTVIRKAAADDPWLRENAPRVEWIFGTQGVEVQEDHPLFQAVSQSIQAVTGEAPFVNPLHSASDIRNPILFSHIPCVGIGPLAGTLAHDGFSDPWVDVGDYLRAVEVTARIIREWCQSGRVPQR
jgi:acetylornithine deacetylase/succinyl-diaminopimelate desuccinylase-like protein